ncbi:MAG: fructose-bisphosphatase class II [Cyanobacteria bacterium QS_8_64_29]|nr:MAG: fructose-bisphosphatase class II [Cyanobacteria bacterium QS_8_64_29]
MEQTLGLDVIEAVERAAIASAKWTGKGEKNQADQAAVEAMRARLNEASMHGRIVIGEGERDDAPMLYIGEEVGKGTQAGGGTPGLPEIDIAVDPCEGTSLVAQGQNGSMAVLAIAERGNLVQAPDIYMDKLAAPPAARGKLDIRNSIQDNLKTLAGCLDLAVEDIVVAVMNRSRHDNLIAEIRQAGARVRLIDEGDISAALACAFAGSSVHALMGIGAAPEGVITAAAMRCLGGHFQGQLVYDPAVVKTGLIGNSKEENRQRLQQMGVQDPDQPYKAEELARGDNVLFAACGITPGELMDGVRFFPGGMRTENLVISTQSQTARFTDTRHLTGSYKWLDR